MSAGLSLGAAFLLGLVASGHCLLMCGGITGALASVTRPDSRGCPRLDLLLGYQVGRICSYMLAGLSLAGIGAALVQFVDQDHVRLALRWLSAALFALLGLHLLVRGRGFDLGLGRQLWGRLAPLGRRFIPVQRLSQALAFGAVWGWMPCGLVYSVLFIAWASMDPLRSALIMAMFGLGTLPAVLGGAYGAGRSIAFLGRSGMRSSVAVVLLLFAALTAGGPWLVAHSGMHSTHWLPFDCDTQ
jgi:uncharacterized protein